MRQALIAVVVGCLLIPPAWAGSLSGVTLPDEVTVSGKKLQLNGMGLRQKLWIEVYVAGLYLEQKTSDAGQAVDSSQTKRVVMHFLTDKATKKKMDSAWREGFEANSPSQFPSLKARVDTFVSYFGDMKEGDVIELTMEAGKGTAVVLNGQEKGTIEGDDFSAALLRVWLGATPPAEDLKAGMLGG